MNQLQFKVYLVENKATKEIRKFSVDSDVAENFEYLAGKIRQVFPDLLRKDFEVFWKDQEEDYLTISSDEELNYALQGIDEDVHKLFVKTKKEKEHQKAHPGITCDGCNSQVEGIRYKCTQCYDFDLCSSCEDKSDHPSDHEMICIKLPRSTDNFRRHPGFFRGGFRPRDFPFQRCSGPRRFKCGPNQSRCNKENPAEKSGDFIGHLASSFGLDPEVAKGYFVSFQDDLKAHQKKAEENKTSEKEGSDERASMEQAFGINPELIAQIFTSMSQSCPEKKDTDSNTKKSSDETAKDDKDEPMNVEEKNESAEPEEDDVTTPTEPSTENKNEFEEMVNHFSKQFGLTPEAQKHIQGGLGNLLQGIFNPSNFSESSQKEQEDVTKPESFIFVDEDNKLTEEEKSQKRLEKALKQMEAMGFDNDGGWLSQLLVAKDLSIARVLDALNPSS